MIDDLFSNESVDGTIEEAFKQGFYEIEVKIKYQEFIKDEIDEFHDSGDIYEERKEFNSIGTGNKSNNYSGEIGGG